MANIFNSVSVKSPKRHKFKLNHQVKLTGEMGELLPIMCEPVLPGDRFKLSSSQLVRFAPMVAPIMSDIDVYTHFFFVPNRLIWDNWETFITGSKKGKKLPEDEVPVPPRLGVEVQYMGKVPENKYQNSKKVATAGTLLDYLGFPTTEKDQTGASQAVPYYIDELPLRAYQRIFFDWYRDENLSSFDDFEVINGDSFNNGDNLFSSDVDRSMLLMKLQRRAWKKDYFTSALPFAQKGDDVLIPGTGLEQPTEPLPPSTTLGNLIRKSQDVSDFMQWGTNDGISHSVLSHNQGENIHSEGTYETVLSTTNNTRNQGSLGSIALNLSNLGVEVPSAQMLRALNENVSEGTIRELRRAMAAQRFLEREAVGGTRYIEQILSFFGVRSSDARLQRSEFLGGSKQPVVISQVLQTSESTQNSPLGQPAGNAVSAGGKYIFDRTFEEHGFIIGVMSVMPRAEYMSGMPRKYLKRDRYDYYWPQFAHIGEQPIYKQELQYDFNADFSFSNNETFGYTPRYAEYRFINNHVHGDFKTSLKFWTLARDYGDNAPILNESFIECNPSNRIYAYEDSDFSHLWIQVAFNISALRPLPKYGESI